MAVGSPEATLMTLVRGGSQRLAEEPDARNRQVRIREMSGRAPRRLSLQCRTQVIDVGAEQYHEGPGVRAGADGISRP